MRFFGSRFRRILIVLVGLALLPLAYWLGYRAGYQAKLPDPWAIAIVRRNPDGTILGSSFSWYDRNKPAEEAALHREEARLKSIHEDFYVAKGRVEATTTVEPDPPHASSHR